jgi:hypothetical protein
MATGCGSVPAWGRTGAWANRYHEHPSRGKHPAGPSDKTYRLDAPAVRAFLDDFVRLP